MNRTRNRLEVDELFELANEQVRWINEITNRTLAWQRAPRAVNVSLPALVDNVLSSYKPRLEYAGVDVTRCFETGDTLKASPQDLRQLIANLLSNAIDVVPRGGRIAVRVRTSRDWGDLATTGIRLTVADNGPGIPSDIGSKIYEPFFTTKRDPGAQAWDYG